MDIVVLDFETYYDKNYSLSKMTTEAYIRDPRFEVIGVAVKVNNFPACWYSGDDFGGFLKSLDLGSKAVLCHNAVFDGAILSWHFGIRPRFWLDTLSMSRPFHSMTVGGSLAKLAAYYGLGEKGTEVVSAAGKRRADFTEEELARYGQYCINDVELTKRLFDKLKVGFPISELLVIDQTIRMFSEPMIELDAPLLEKHLQEVRARKQELIAELAQTMGGEEVAQKVLMSNDKFADYLKSLGVEPPTKISPRTGKQTWAFAKTDKGMTDLLEHPDERVQVAVAARLGVKSTLEETRTEALIGVAKRGRLPIMLNYYGAHTGRFSGGDKLNLQNLPSRGDTTIKRALKAPPGYVLVAADSSQIEARLVAYIAGQDDLVEAFREKRDVYSEFATEVYGRKITKADKVERFVGKTCIAEGTLVLTEKGWKPIECITVDDLLWDGKEWVCHQGLLQNGIKPTLNLCGVWLTPDHLVWSGTQWMDAQSVVKNANILYQALAHGRENLPSQATLLAPVKEFAPSLYGVTATESNTLLKTLEAINALFAQKKKGLLSVIENIKKQCQTINTEFACLTALIRQFLDAIAQPIVNINTAENAVFAYAQNGYKTGQRFYDTYKPLKGGITLITKWLELIKTGIMNQGTSNLYHVAQKENSLTLKRVFDVLDCGSRNRFTILTEAGPLIVHNCILGLGYGMGAAKLQRTLEIGQGGISVKVDLNEAERLVHIYRTKNFRIAQFWQKCGNALADMIEGRSGSLHDILPYDSTGITLPSGFKIQYPALRATLDGFVYANDPKVYQKVINGEDVDDTEWVRIYSGKVAENITQALAALVIREQMVSIGRWYRVVFQVHDEIIIAAPEEEAEEAKAKLEEVMSVPPQWAPDLPVACEAGVATNYGDT